MNETNSTNDSGPSMKTQGIVLAALLLLLAATMGCSLIGLGRFELIANLGIAGLKAALVALFFMQVRYSSPVVRLFAVLGLLFLALLMGLSLADYLSRDWL